MKAIVSTFNQQRQKSYQKTCDWGLTMNFRAEYKWYQFAKADSGISYQYVGACLNLF